jgi:four helix bundle protein
MNNENLKRRTREFALRVVKLVEAAPKSATAQVLGRQLLRAGTSVGANYRAATRARSNADFIARMGIVEEEADETVFWLELLRDAGLLPPAAVAVASINTARRTSVRNAAKGTADSVPHSALRAPR